MAGKAEKWIRFLRQYGPIPRNDNMYDEHIRRSAARTKMAPLLFEHPIERELLSAFDASATERKSVILTGTAGDGKTHLCRIVWQELGGSEEDWDSDRVYFDINTQIAGKETTVHIVRDLTGLPEVGETGSFGTKTELLEFFSHVIFEDSNSVFLIAANDGQLVDTWSRLNRKDSVIDDTGHLLEDLLFNDQREKEGSKLKLFNLSRISSAHLFDRALQALVEHDGWQDCYSEADSENGLFGSNCPVRHNYELLKGEHVVSRLRNLLELCDHNDVHFSIRRLLLLLSNALLGFAGKEAEGKKVPDRLLRAVDVPRVIASNQKAKCSIYNNIFGGNLTNYRRSSLDIFEYLGRFRIGHETSNRFDNLLIYGDSEPDLEQYFEKFLASDEFYGADEMYRAAQQQYIEGADESEERTNDFLELLVSQRRGLFFKIPDDDADELSPWALTVFNYAGEYLERVLHRLGDERRVEKGVLSRLARGLNRIFVGMLVSSEQELWLATGLSGSSSKVSYILEDRVSVTRRAKEYVAIVKNDSGFPVLRVSFDEEISVDLKLTLTRFEFLM